MRMKQTDRTPPARGQRSRQVAEAAPPPRDRWYFDQRWRRPFDTVAAKLTVSGISGVHALYLARGGYDFLIGDGRTARNTYQRPITAPSYSRCSGKGRGLRRVF